ncbi:MAG: aconitate hydratase [Nitrospirae bacterium GWC2_57_13]|jgi:aconitate hydratase|nr:MAG: aconitate hydratase [Nitrospirae bacterium GWC2_57_13]OGW45260.1 MAG: aconitate hydratase [Nitrospirae bacterium GWD2_57_8]
MGKNLVEKILKAHLVEGTLEPGNEIAIRIDQTLTQDATGTMAYLQFEAMGVDRVATELSVSYVDHNTLQDGFENADDHRYLQTVAAKHGIHYSKAGNGICHQVHLERFGRPGKTLLGSDSHTPTGGGIGMFAVGAGGLDVAVAMGGGPFYLTCPKVVKVNLSGKLKPWVAAKDVILAVLEMLTTKGNVGTVLEYGGEGVATLSVPERATITNMGAELGVTTSVFPSDAVAKAFLKAQKREQDWIVLEADTDATYDRVIDIDLGSLVPRVARPHSPDNIATVKDVAGTKVDQVMVGSCTNSSFRDLMIVASLLKGKKVHPDVSFGIAPGSRQVLEMIARNGGLADIIASGARVLESTCGFCIGAGQAPRTDAVSVRTSNRNFEGRSGTKSAGIYLTSPETAVASALTGKITDPRDLGIAYPEIAMPAEFWIDDSLVLPPSERPESITIYRGPNIGDPPKGEPLPDTIKGIVAIKVGDKITTDHIMPAGSRLKYRSNIPRYAEFVFEALDPDFSKQALENKKAGIHNVIIAGLSYGQGSSREHAAICPMYLGIKAVVAKSFERIHAANLINFGILPLIFANEADYDSLNAKEQIEISSIRAALQKGTDLTLRTAGGKAIAVTYSLSLRQKDILLAGGMLNYTRSRSG